MFALIEKWFPIPALAVTFVNAIIIRRRSQKLIQEEPELEQGYQKLFWGYIISGSLPWMVMAVGMLIGKVPTAWHFLDVLGGNPYVIACWIVLIGLQLVGGAWICFLGGAEFLIEYYWPVAPERTRSRSLVKTPLGLKITFVVSSILGTVGLLVIAVAKRPEVLDRLPQFWRFP